MSRRSKKRAQVSHERWLVSYADFVTLLFAFFVVLYATAQIDKRRALQLSDAIQSGFQEMGVPDMRGALSSAPGTAETSTSSTGLQSANATNSATAPGYDLDRIQYELERAPGCPEEKTKKKRAPHTRVGGGGCFVCCV